MKSYANVNDMLRDIAHDEELITMVQIETTHPLPWRVKYPDTLGSWHPQSIPCVVDAAGKLVCSLPQNVTHPGMYDAVADETAKRICEAVNAQAGVVPNE